MSERKLKVGVVGIGMGSAHLELGYSRNPNVEITALADPDAARLAGVAASYPQARCYPSAEAMFAAEQLDLVSICTPNRYHRPLALLAFEHGCHVLCEKPMATNAAEAREMNEAARCANRRLMVHFSTRFRRQSQMLKAQVDAGKFGEFYFGRTYWHRRDGAPRFGGWFGMKELSGGGPLIDLGVHRLDLALWLMGFPKPTSILASTYNPLMAERARQEGKAFDVEELAVANIRFENGATLLLEASWALHQKEYDRMETSLYGTKAGFTQRNVGEGGEYEAEIYFRENGEHFDQRLHPLGPEVPLAGIDHFVDAILHDTPHTATGEEGLLVQEILDALYESAASGQAVNFASA